MHDEKMKLQTNLTGHGSHEAGHLDKHKRSYQRFEGSYLDWPRFWGLYVLSSYTVFKRLKH